MMKITYIGHSGFSVELESHILLFDYYEGTMPEFDPAKKLLVFASHSHPDHFNREILKLADVYPNVELRKRSSVNRNISCEKGMRLLSGIQR